MALGRDGELAGDLLGEPRGVELLGREADRLGVEPGEIEEVGRELRQPLDLAAHRPDELAPALAVGLRLVVEQLDETAERGDRRAQLVGGVGDELPPRGVQPAQPPLHLVERQRELTDLVREPIGIGTLKSPWATRSAARSSRRRRRAW